MPTSSSAAINDKKKSTRVSNKLSQKRNCENFPQTDNNNVLKIASAIPPKRKSTVYVRSHSALNATSLKKIQENHQNNEDIQLKKSGPDDGALHVLRSQSEKEKHPDRICLDRRGLTHVPIIEPEIRLRLLSLQHNLIFELENLGKQKFPTLVFLDLYDNQLEQIDQQSFSSLENLRVLLMGKNRIKQIEGLENLPKLEILDLHGNQIKQITTGLFSRLSLLKVLNLAGNQITNIGVKDLHGLDSLQELNLRRNRLKKVMGCGGLNNLIKLFLSNNDLQSVEDICNIAKSPNIEDISIDGNPVFLSGDCISFLVSYLPHLLKLNTMQITEQVKKAAMAWKRNKESTNTTFMDLTAKASANHRREEVISNARTNWELLRSQTKCLANNSATTIEKSKNLKPDSDFVLTSLTKSYNNSAKNSFNRKLNNNNKVPYLLLNDKHIRMSRTPSQDTENSQNTSNSSTSNEFLKLPPILVPIICKLGKREIVSHHHHGPPKRSGSLTSIGPNIDSSSSLASDDDDGGSEQEDESSSSENSELIVSNHSAGNTTIECRNNDLNTTPDDQLSNFSNSTINASTSESEKLSFKSKITTTTHRNIKSAFGPRNLPVKCINNNNNRAATAKVKKTSPILLKDREQGGDYLIEICGRYLNIYGQGALRFIDKNWCVSKANDVTTIKFNYINFNSIVGYLSKTKIRFPNADNFIFKETNIIHLGQLNGISEIQGLTTSLFIDSEGNPIHLKEWKNYAIYRLSHWGLKIINDIPITDTEIEEANEQYRSLSDLILWSLPEIILQPLLSKLRIDLNKNENAKKWLQKADPELKKVVSKEALQWKKSSSSNNEDILMRQKAKQHISNLFDEMTDSMHKLRILEDSWPEIMHNFVQNTLLDYSQLDIYMKRKIQELMSK